MADKLDLRGFKNLAGLYCTHQKNGLTNRYRVMNLYAVHPIPAQLQGLQNL
jgi:hypothetical protein